jgi:hypothetical protein
MSQKSSVPQAVSSVSQVLKRDTIKRQSENESGKLELERMANSDGLIEIASLIGNMALPTGIEPVFQP